MSYPSQPFYSHHRQISPSKDYRIPNGHRHVSASYAVPDHSARREDEESEYWGSSREDGGWDPSYDELLDMNWQPKRPLQRQTPLSPAEELQQKLQDVQELLRQAVEDRTLLEERSAWALKQLGEAQSHAEKAEQRLEATRLHFQTRLEQLEDELASKDEVIREYLEDRDTVRRSLDFERQRSDAQTTALTQELKAAYCQLNEVEQRIEQRVESTKSHFQSQIDDLSDVLNSRDREIEFLSKELDKADACIQSDRNQFHKQSEIYSNALKAKCAETDSLRQHLKSAELKVAKVNEHLQAKEATIEALRRQLDEARRDSQVKGRLVAKLSVADVRQQARASPSPVMHSSGELQDDPVLFVQGSLKCFNDKLLDTAFMSVQFLQDVQLKVPSASQEDRDSADRVLGSRLVQLISQRKVRRRRGVSDTHPRLAQLVLQLFLTHWMYAVMDGSYSVSQQNNDDFTVYAFHECVLDILHDLASVLWVFGWRVSGFDELVAAFDAAKLSERLPTLPIYQAFHSLVRDAYELRMAMTQIPAFMHAEFVIAPCDTPFQSESMEDADSDFHTLRLVSNTSSGSGAANGGYLIGCVGIGLQRDSTDGAASRSAGRRVETLLRTRVVLDYSVESLLK